MALPQSFMSKKKLILSKLAVPTDEYDDLSPKGSVDVGIRELIDEINAIEGCVTTSSCAGRVSVFLEGKRNRSENAKLDPGADEMQERAEKSAGVGGKGAGGRWLFVSHDPVDVEELRSREDSKSLHALFGMSRRSSPTEGAPENERRDTRYVHFKFEPMILHILTASPDQAQKVLTAALQAGFRESGALNLVSATLEAPTPMVGVRSMGLALESLIGVYDDESGEVVCDVEERQLGTLLRISNERFVENTMRIERFRGLLRGVMISGEKKKLGHGGVEWEDANTRKERKRAEGLSKAMALKQARNGVRRTEDGTISTSPLEVTMDLPLDTAIIEDGNEMKS